MEQQKAKFSFFKAPLVVLTGLDVEHLLTFYLFL